MIAGPSSVQTPATQFNEIDRPPQFTTTTPPPPITQPTNLFLASQYDTNWAQRQVQSVDGDLSLYAATQSCG